MEQNTEQGVILSALPESRYEIINDGLPLECMDPVCENEKDIDQIMETLWNDLQMMETHAAAANRFSENYRIVSRGLEKTVRRLGSLILTKTVFEQQGYTCVMPEELTISRLACTANYHFNKTHAAVIGTQMNNPKFYTAMMIQEVRWASLLERLDATQEKIIKIRAGKLNIRIVRQNRRQAKPAETSGGDHAAAAMNLSAPSALPIAYELFPENMASCAGNTATVYEEESGENLPSRMPETGPENNSSAEKTIPEFDRDLCEKFAAVSDDDIEAAWEALFRKAGPDDFPDIPEAQDRCPVPFLIPESEPVYSI